MSRINVNGAMHDAYFVHRLEVEDLRSSSRLSVLQPLVAGKTVLHVGNVDWPITDVANNLHLKLAESAKKIDGLDPNKEGAELVKVSNGEQFTDWDSLKDREYDWILVPEVVEHVGSFVELFKALDAVKGTLLITAPCAWACNEFFQKGNMQPSWTEVVHPDHNCWFTPYTLKNVIEKYGRRRVSRLFWIGSISIAAIAE